MNENLLLIGSFASSDPRGVGHGEGDGARRGLRDPADVGAVQRGHRALPDAAARALLLAARQRELPRQEPVAHPLPDLRQVSATYLLRLPRI